MTRPDVVEQLHRSFLDVGVDVVETNSFGAFSVVLAEYGIADRAHELALASAPDRAAGRRQYASPGSPRFVAGSMGPGTKFPTLGQITYDDLSASYEELAYGLLEGGVDLLARRDDVRPALGQGGDRRLPPRDGPARPRGADPGAGHDRADRADAARHRDRRRHHGARRHWASTCSGSTARPVRSRCTSHCALSATAAPLPLSCLPNAGLPSVVDGQMHYDLTPDALAEHLSKFVTEYGVQRRRGVLRHDAGSTSTRVVEARATARRPPSARPSLEPAVASIYSRVTYQPGPLGPAGRRAHQRQRFEEVPRSHARGRLGHLRRDRPRPDQRGRPRPRRLRRLHRRRRRRRHERAHEPAGHAVLGADHGRHHRGARRASGAHLARRQGHAQLGEPRRGRRPGHAPRRLPVAGRASSAPPSWPPASTRRARRAPPTGRCAPPRRITDLAVDALRARRPGHLHRRAGPAPVDGHGRVAPRRHRDHRGDPSASRPSCPGVRTILGLSNISFGLNPAARQVLNSVFLHECAEAGLDAAIVHASKILPLASHRRARRARSASTSSTTGARDDYDPLTELLRLFEGVSDRQEPTATRSTTSTSTSACSRRIIDGARVGLEGDLDAAMGDGRRAPRHRQRRSCSTACASSATSSPAARCSCPSSCRAPRP